MIAPDTDYDVLVVGGGMVGSLLCASLAQLSQSSRHPLRVGLLEDRLPDAFEPGTDPPYDLRVSALSIASENMLRNVGAWAGITSRRACIYQRLSVWDGKQSGRTDFNAADSEASHLGHIVENRVIQLSLLDALRAYPNVTIVSPARLNSLRVLHDKVLVKTNHEMDISARLLVGADGANSVVRRESGVVMQKVAYPQHALVANIKTDLKQQDITWQRFLPSGPQAMLPLCGSRASIVWYHDEAEIARLSSLDDAAFKAELQHSFPSLLGGVNNVQARAAFPIAKAHASTYTAPRTALVGDAAHTVHPLAGQGVNIGMLDAGALADVIINAHSKGRSIADQSVLRRYQRARYFDNQLMITALDSLYEAFKAQPGVVREARSASLNMVNRISPLKTHIMRRAMGVEGELPSLAK